MGEAAESIWTEQQEAAYQAVIVEAKQKYNAGHVAWIDFVMYLREVELSGAWRRPGDSQFAEFLRREFPTAFGAERYSNIVKAVEVYGREFMARVGVEAAHCLTTDAMLTTKGAAGEVRGWCEEHWRVHGVMPGHEEVLGYTKKFSDEPRRPPRLVLQQTEVRRLRAENQQLMRGHSKAVKAIEAHETLREENARLKVELKAANAKIRTLERELSTAKKQLDKFERSGGANSAGTARGGGKEGRRGSRRRSARASA
jgi:hypothetical protein